MTVARAAGEVSSPRRVGPPTLLDFSDLAGWSEDDHAAALRVFRETCGAMQGRELGQEPADRTKGRA